MGQPVMVFESQEHLQKCIEEWKRVLFLTDWTIRGFLVEPPLKDEYGIELEGQNEFDIANKCAGIRIVKPYEDMKDWIVKYCAECILVHELLHCKYNWTYKDDKTLEYVYYEELEHGLIEQMAKSLIMTKYGLPFEWFRNFE